MIDKSLPYVPLFLYKEDPQDYPKYELPAGFRFTPYQRGDEVAWAELECSLGQFATVEEGVRCFEREFPADGALDLGERVFFVRDDTDAVVATAALWEGEFCGEICPRAHWLAVSDACAGRGIAKAVFCHILDLYRQLHLTGTLYLLTATWYYPAIAIYRSFGFSFYEGESSLSQRLSDEEYQKSNTRAYSCGI
jgi:GNAT superfamily N-acetyltransferase